MHLLSSASGRSLGRPSPQLPAGSTRSPPVKASAGASGKSPKDRERDPRGAAAAMEPYRHSSQHNSPSERYGYAGTPPQMNDMAM